MRNTKYIASSTTITPVCCAENSVAYEIPYGVDEKQFYEYLKEFTNLAKSKGLTIRQAQTLFQVCSEYVLDSKLV